MIPIDRILKINMQCHFCDAMIRVWAFCSAEKHKEEQQSFLVLRAICFLCFFFFLVELLAIVNFVFVFLGLFLGDRAR